MKKSLIYCLFLLPSYLIGQEIKLQFAPVYNNNTQLSACDLKGDSLSIHTLRFYLSHFILLRKGKEIWREQNSSHLLDMEDINTLTLHLKPNTALDFDAISFDLGIDSLTNVSGVMGGDLDPTNGMYWAWNSGYINFKIEGFYAKCPARNHEFQFHIGGYMPPFKAVQTINLAVSNKHDIQVDMDLSLFFENIDLTKTHGIMSPSAEAVKLAKLLSTIFSCHEE